MQRARVHTWDTVDTFAGRRRGSLHAVVLCRYCGLLTIANLGSSPLRPGPCDGARPAPPPIVWATRRPQPLAPYHWLLRAR